MRIATIIALGFIVVPSLAAAEGELTAPRYFDLIASPPTDNHITFVRQLLPPTSAVVAQSKIIYLNHVGATLRPGDNDARTQHSSLVNSNVNFPAWNTSAAHWQSTVACMKDMFKRWDVTVTDVDPGTAPHIEAMFGG